MIGEGSQEHFFHSGLGNWVDGRVGTDLGDIGGRTGGEGGHMMKSLSYTESKVFGGYPGEDVQQAVGYKGLVHRDLEQRWRYYQGREVEIVVKGMNGFVTRKSS